MLQLLITAYGQTKVQKYIAGLWARVDRPSLTACWIWTGPRSGKNRNYGSCWFRLICTTHPIQVHRIIWLLFRGPIPKGKEVCHSCLDGDNSLCCNPRHLWLGTHRENVRDCVAKHRHHSQTHPNDPSVRGHACHTAKLRGKQVLAIRRAVSRGATRASQAKKYKVSWPNIDAIVTRKSWRHI